VLDVVELPRFVSYSPSLCNMVQRFQSVQDLTSVSADSVHFGLLVQYMMPDCCINICNYDLSLLNAQNWCLRIALQPMSSSDRKPADAHPNEECQHNALYRVSAG